MRTALMSHFYPPAPSGGAGIYAATLADGLQRTGIDSCVLCVGDWSQGEQYLNGYTDDVRCGIPVRRLQVNWTKAVRPFDYLFDSPPLGRQIESYLEAVQPDLVHVISCYTLSAQAILTPKRLGLPVVLHLVDMWFICPRHTLLRKDGSLCHGSQGDWDCQRCMLWGTKAYRLSGKLLTDSQQEALFRRLGQVGCVSRLPGLRGILGNMGLRRQVALDALLQADVVLAPSRSLQSLHETNGVPAESIRYLPYGHSVAWAKQVTRHPSSKIRFGFLGNILPLKGVHVLIDAFGKISQDGAAELHLYGYDLAAPTYVKQLKAKSVPGVFWHGEYTRADLPQILGSIDVVIFTSIWHENNPLVIQEAFAGGCPVITSDIGGAAEAVRCGIDGLHFKAGDASDLAKQMRRLIEDVGLIEQLRNNIRPVHTIEEELADIRTIYQQVLNSPG